MPCTETLPCSLRVLHLDDTLVVVDKPSGLLSVPGRGEARADCVVARVRALGAPDAREVHRLDQATSGLMVLARGAEAHRTLSMAFAARAVDKVYSALAAGDWMADTGADAGWIELPLIADWPHRPRQCIDLTRGKPSTTQWVQLGREMRDGQVCSRLDLVPHTGRSHQLRLHCLALGHPLLGDDLYAPEPVRRALPRLGLHARHLALRHPATQAWLAFDAPTPF